MNINLWFFLSVGAIFGVLFTMFVIYLDHQKKTKQLEIEALNNKNLESRVEVLEAIANEKALNEKFATL